MDKAEDAASKDPQSASNGDANAGKDDKRGERTQEEKNSSFRENSILGWRSRKLSPRNQGLNLGLNMGLMPGLLFLQTAVVATGIFIVGWVVVATMVVHIGQGGVMVVELEVMVGMAEVTMEVMGPMVAAALGVTEGIPLVAMEAALALMVGALGAMEVVCWVAMGEMGRVSVAMVVVVMVVAMTLELGVGMAEVVPMGVGGEAMVAVAIAGTTHMQGRMLLAFSEQTTGKNLPEGASEQEMMEIMMARLMSPVSFLG